RAAERVEQIRTNVDLGNEVARTVFDGADAEERRQPRHLFGGDAHRLRDLRVVGVERHPGCPEWSSAIVSLWVSADAVAGASTTRSAWARCSYTTRVNQNRRNDASVLRT